MANFCGRLFQGRAGRETLGKFYPAAGYGAGDNNSQAIITPVIAVGTSAGVVYLISVSTLQVENPPWQTLIAMQEILMNIVS